MCKVFLTVGALLILVVNAQFGSPTGIGRKAKPLKSADKYVKCQVCQEVTKQMVRQAKELKHQLKRKGKPLGEDQIIDLTENVCEPLEDQGEWVTRLDMQKGEKGVILKDMGETGSCGRECETIAKSCRKVMDKADLYFSSHIYQAFYPKNANMETKKIRSMLTQHICYDGGFCGKRFTKVKATVTAEKWKKAADGERKIANIRSKMTGMGGKDPDIYSQQDLMETYQSIKDAGVQDRPIKDRPEDHESVGERRRRLRSEYPWSFMGDVYRTWDRWAEMLEPSFDTVREWWGALTGGAKVDL